MHSIVRSRLAAALMTATLAVTGCSGLTPASSSPAANGSSASPTTSDPASAPITITYQTHSNAAIDEFNQELVDEFEAAHPDVTVEYMAVPYENYEAGLLSGFVGGGGPDLFWIGDWVVPQFNQAGVLAEFNPDAYGMSREQFIAQYEPQSVLDPYLVGGKLYTAGISEFNVVSLVYNSAQFAEVGIDPPSPEQPLTWEQFAEIAGRLTKYTDGQKVRQGWAYWSSLDIWTVLVLQPMLNQLGGELIDGSGRARFDSSEMRKVMTYLAELRAKHDAFDPAFTTDPLADFANGRLSMALLGPWGVPVIQAQEGIGADVEIGVAPLPVWQDGERAVSQYSWSWQVNATAPPERQAVAWELAAFLNSVPNKWFDRAGYIQPKTTGITPGKTVLDTIRESNPHVEVFERDFAFGRSQFRSPNYNQIAKLWTQAATLVLEGTDVDEALRQAQAAADSIGD